MKDKTEISYWLKEPGIEDVTIELFRTATSKVPVVGEIIHINTLVDKEWLYNTFKDLPDMQKLAFFPLKDSQIKGDFVVVSVKRWIKTPYRAEDFHSVFKDELTGKVKGPSIPVSSIDETFEVFVEPFRHTELTETPTAKLRNLLGSIFVTFEMLNLIKEHPSKEKEIMDMFKDNLSTANDSISKIRVLLNNDNILKK